MKASVAVCAALVPLAACAADTMRGYVGQDIRAVTLAYGPPANEIDLGGGTRAFQWSKASVDTAPPSAVTTTERDRKGRRVTRTEFVGGTQTVTDCVYTFLAARDPRRDGWVVTGFRQPSLDCAIGGLNW
jgi:predicted small secreted protein